MKKISLILCCLAPFSLTCSLKRKNSSEDSLAKDTTLSHTNSSQPPDSLQGDT